MSTPTDTPRTDANAFDHDNGAEIVSAEFARTLERENAQLREEFAQCLDGKAAMCRKAAAVFTALADGRMGFERACLILSDAITEETPCAPAADG